MEIDAYTSHKLILSTLFSTEWTSYSTQYTLPAVMELLDEAEAEYWINQL